MGRLIVYCIISLICFSCSQEKAMNVIWIVSDDLGTDLGCYGNDAVDTPNLDRLASESTLYTNFHTVTAVCSPSRSALITGMYPVSINAHQHRTRLKQPLPNGVKPITEYFKQAGYYVANANATGKRRGKTDYNFQYSFEGLYDGVNPNERKEGQPFFAQYQVFLPHRPFKADTISPVDPEDVNIPPYYPDHPMVRKDWALYLETIQHVDKQVGKLMDRLEEEGLLENTVVLFFGDQGRPHLRAKQWLYDPGTNTPLMVRWPNMAGAGTTSDRLVSNVDISATSLGIAGIALPDHLHGVDFLDEAMAQRDHLFTMRDRRDETVDRIRAIRTQDYKYIRNYYPERPYTQFNAYKKFWYPTLTLMEVMHSKGELSKEQSYFMAPRKPREELYDLRNDPYEVKNVVDTEEYEFVVNELRQVMDNYLAQYDKGVYPESDEEIQLNIDFMKERYKKNMESVGLSAESTNREILEYWQKKLLGQ